MNAQERHRFRPTNLQPASYVVRAISLAIFLSAAAVLTACNGESSGSAGAGGYDAVNKNDCLPPIKLIDQNGHEFMLSSLKGKPVVIDFIYTSCPGPCITLTQKMANIAQKLGGDLGQKATLVSLSIDPEHDGPKQMADYARKQGVEAKGWLFLTWEPTNVDAVMSAFRMKRERDEDGGVMHVIGVFLVGPDGRELKEYNGEILKSEKVAADVRSALAKS
jgi:protein SCO1/2